jgi:hypothetical protein
MKTLIFGGSSDDTFGEITPRGDDYDNCASGKPIEWLIESASEKDSLLVVGQYCPGAATGWLIGVARADEDDGKFPPAWPIHIRPRADGSYRCTYSHALEIVVPDDATIRCLQRREDA